MEGATMGEDDGDKHYRHANELPTGEWLSVVVNELLDEAGCSHKIAANVCAILFMKVTAQLRTRLVEQRDRFNRSMELLAQRISSSTVAEPGGEPDFDVEELGSALIERIPKELLATVEPPPEPAAEPKVKMEAPLADDAPDPVFERAKEAQKASLLAEGQRVVSRLQRVGDVGRDGRRAGDKWRVVLVPASPPKPKGKARGRHVASGKRAHESDDEPTEDDKYDAQIAAELAGTDESVAPPPAAKGPRSLGPAKRLGNQLDLQFKFACELCNGEPVKSRVAMVSHRNRDYSCIRAGSKPRKTSKLSASAGSSARLDQYIASSCEPPPAMSPAAPPASPLTSAVPTATTTPASVSTAVPTPGSSAGASPGLGRGGRSGGRTSGGASSCGGGLGVVKHAGGRGRKSAATKEMEKASLAAWLARKYGAEGSRLAAKAAERAGGEVAAAAAVDDEVECLGETTAAERDAAGFAAAVDINEPAAPEPAPSEPTSEPAASEKDDDATEDDSQDEAIGGGKAGQAEEISFSLDDLSQSQGL